ncbi:MAG: barstar family protein [Cytophagales bacterium]|nr:barstar family protein [Cytophagales bacterium]MCA6374032.1 barstar family protein [Cytophagales bacterium]MCA6376436.1 barstar family protein [Cytophagales bacterium]MCA6386100.1 barstar family protein [Cytophagales bacterium]
MKKLLSKDIIKKWNNGENIDWRQLTTDEKGEWLLACLYTTGLPKGTIEDKNYIIDGSQVNEPVDVYCDLGQIFIGDRGYLGSGLDGLHDCLIDIKVPPGTVLTIKHHRRLADILSKRFDNYFDVFTDTLKEHGLTLKLV